MSVIGKLAEGLQGISSEFTIEALAKDLQPEVEAAMTRHQLDRQRESKLSPRLMIWLILSLPLRRELSYLNVLNWLLSGFRFLGFDIARNPVAEVRSVTLASGSASTSFATSSTSRRTLSRRSRQISTGS